MTIKENSSNNALTFPLFVFPLLPELNFWTACNGKDSLSFLSIAAILYSVSRIHERKLILISGLFLLFFLRMHIAGFFVISLTLGFLFLPTVSLRKKYIIVAIMAIFSLLAALWLSKFFIRSNHSLFDYLSMRQSSFRGTSGVDLSKMPFWQILPQFIFSPFWNFSSGIVLAGSSICNIFLLVFTSYLLLKGKFLRAFQRNPFLMVTAFCYFAISFSMLALAITNMGAAFRQKLMLYPPLFLMLVVAYSFKDSPGNDSLRKLFRNLLPKRK
ncbi:MAG: hypothetical protein GY915_01840 [bacterium]|nr:hypothetical protein [bacterium]